MWKNIKSRDSKKHSTFISAYVKRSRVGKGVEKRVLPYGVHTLMKGVKTITSKYVLTQAV